MRAPGSSTKSGRAVKPSRDSPIPLKVCAGATGPPITRSCPAESDGLRWPRRGPRRDVSCVLSASVPESRRRGLAPGQEQARPSPMTVRLAWSIRDTRVISGRLASGPAQQRFADRSCPLRSKRRPSLCRGSRVDSVRAGPRAHRSLQRTHQLGLTTASYLATRHWGGSSSTTTVTT